MGDLAYSRGYAYFFLPNVPGATFIQGGLFRASSCIWIVSKSNRVNLWPFHEGCWKLQTAGYNGVSMVL